MERLQHKSPVLGWLHEFISNRGKKIRSEDGFSCSRIMVKRKRHLRMWSMHIRPIDWWRMKGWRRGLEPSWPPFSIAKILNMKLTWILLLYVEVKEMFAQTWCIFFFFWWGNISLSDLSIDYSTRVRKKKKKKLKTQRAFTGGLQIAHQRTLN